MNAQVFDIEKDLTIKKLINLRKEGALFHCYVRYKNASPFREGSRKYFYSSQTNLQDFIKVASEIGRIKNVEFGEYPSTAPWSELEQALEENRVVL